MHKQQTILVLGGTGATGRLLIDQLINRGHQVKAIVRSADRLPASVKNHPNLTVIEASILDLSDADLVKHVANCHAVASCLGHNLTFKGIYGHPRKLVTDSIRRACAAIYANGSNKPVKVVLMNTTGNSNRDLNEQISAAETFVVGLLRLLLPPHTDNEAAADYLRTEIGQNDRAIEWVAVRPDGLINNGEVSDYSAHQSPTRSAIFNAGKTSRINVGHFMADLITNDDLWEKWRGKMPVIYNTADL